MSARILVVDDILPNVKLLEAKLRAEYYEVLTATSGPEALDIAAAEKPDLILLDVMMPGMDGYEVCSQLKANPDLVHIAIVMVTALTDAEDRVRALDLGADDFLSKPIDDIALLARVRSLVRLKVTMDEWRLREAAMSHLGADDSVRSTMQEHEGAGRILVIEDRDFERDKLHTTLEDDHEHVVCTPSGPQAIEALGAHDFDVIVLSMNLAAEDGLRLLSYFKSSEKSRNLAIVLLGEAEDMQRIAYGLDFGAHDYLIRPIERNELKARVRTQMRKKRFQERLRSFYEVSLSMALTDPLTALHNRRYLEAHMGRLLEKNQDHKKTLAVLLMDIDHFKLVNDTYGHGVGDEVLKLFGARLKGKLRSADTIARYGGEEFVIVLPDVTVERAYCVAERLRATIASDPFKCGTPDGVLDVTASIGGVIIHAHEDVSVLKALERADTCLYDAKAGGRNCVYFEGKGCLGYDEIRALSPSLSMIDLYSDEFDTG